MYTIVDKAGKTVHQTNTSNFINLTVQERRNDAYRQALEFAKEFIEGGNTHWEVFYNSTMLDNSGRYIGGGL